MKEATSNAGNGRKNGSESPPAAGSVEAGAQADHTANILAFLEESHGKVRLDSRGDYAYEQVSSISLHFLLQSGIPAKEVLWQWYLHFERDRSESIYQTVRPQDDAVLLEILEACDFEWDIQAVRDSGLVFLSRHRQDVYMALEDFIMARLESYESRSDEELAEVLRPVDTWSDNHLRKLIQKIQTAPITTSQRQAIYDLFDSDYLRATARYQFQEATKEQFWKSPPPEMEDVGARLIIFARTMANAARRLGVYVSRKEFEGQSEAAFGRRRRGRAGASGFRANSSNSNDSNSNGRDGNGARKQSATAAFDLLGLTPEASLLDVKNAYRQKVKQHHPDQGGTVQDFLNLQEAYEVLLTELY